MFMVYHLPVDYPRPTPLNKRDLELDWAIEYLIAGRMENYGETEGEALRTIVWKGPGDATFGIRIALRMPGGLTTPLSRKPTAFAQP